MTTTTVLVCDPLPLLSDSLSIALAAYPEFGVHEERPSNGPAAVEAAVRLRPDIVLLDWWLPDVECPALIRSILSGAPTCNLIVVSSLLSAEQLEQADEAGAVAFLPKDCTVSQIAEAIRRVYRGESGVYHQQLREMIGGRVEITRARREQFINLSPREIEILALLNRGQSTKQIANRLSLSANTVRNYVSRILAKTGTGSAGEALARARRFGFFRD